ncbi:MAG: DUF1565 domain-containing protein [Propionibacteriales bacterium]|nr:DUF1565 domain-containing protein [Propionibacteriales bacterium]
MSKLPGRAGCGSRLSALLAVSVLTILSACQATAPAPAPTPPRSGIHAVSAMRYVSPAGRDTWPGTEQRPWRTLRRALSAMQPAQLLYIRGGDYFETIVKVHVHPGTRSRPIVVLAYPDERPVVHGMVWLRQPSYWTIDGIDVTWDPKTKAARRPMVKLTGGVGWTWQNSEIWGARGSSNVLIAGYGRRQPAKWALTGNCIHDVRPPKLANRSSNLTIADMQSAGPGNVSRNLLFDAPGAQNVIIGSADGGPTDVSFEFNTVYGGGVAVAVGDTTDLRIARNILAGVSSGLLARWNSPHGAGNVVTQNLGEDADAFLRPFAAAIVGGPGNVLDPDLAFNDVSTCTGFHSEDAGALPYGRDAVG